MKLLPRLRDVTDTLAAEGLLAAGAEDAIAPAVAPGTPWYLAAMTGCGGWTAAVFLVASMLLCEPRPEVFLVIGLLLCAAAVGLRYLSDNAFLAQVCLAWSMAGAALAIGALAWRSTHLAVVAGATIAIEGGLVLLYPDRFRRTLSTAVGGVAFAVLVAQTEQPFAMDLAVMLMAFAALGWWLARRPLERSLLHRYHAPVGRGLVLAVLVTLLGALGPIGGKRLFVGWLAGIGFTLALLVLAGLLAREQGMPAPQLAVVLAAVLALGLLTLRTPGVAAAVTVLLIAYRCRDAVLMVFGGAFLLAFGAGYYYNLEATLLVKSGALLGSGLLLLGAHAVLARPAA